MTPFRTVLLGILLMGCTSSPAQTFDIEKLKGAWWKDGEPSFTWLITERTILMEFDMKEHPYRLEENVLIIDFEDPTLGVQRKRILKLTDDELEFKDEQYEVIEVLRKRRPQSLHRAPSQQPNKPPNASSCKVSFPDGP